MDIQIDIQTLRVQKLYFSFNIEKKKGMKKRIESESWKCVLI